MSASAPTASSALGPDGMPNIHSDNGYSDARTSEYGPDQTRSRNQTPSQAQSIDFNMHRPDRDTIVTQDIPVRVLAPHTVQSLHEPVCREPDVHIMFPSLLQLKNISDRFTKLAMTSKSGSASGATGFRGSIASVPKLELSANMHGCLRLRLVTDAMNINSTWTGLTNPELDPGTVEGGEEGIAMHPSTRMKKLGDAEGLSEQGWATVRVEGRDWGRVLGVGRLGGRVIACEIRCVGQAGSYADSNARLLSRERSDPLRLPRERPRRHRISLDGRYCSSIRQVVSLISVSSMSAHTVLEVKDTPRT